MGDARETQIIDKEEISSAVRYLRNGELVAFPTETVYGLGANASDETAIRKLYAAKGRPTNHPVIVHLANIQQLNEWAVELDDETMLLARHFWPGPLTLIVKKSPQVSPLITGGQDTVGIRIPDHPVALALLENFGGGIVAPSANKYGHISSTCAQHVYAEFGDEISMIIDGGQCSVGIESTIVDSRNHVPKILRPGIISEEEILNCVGLNQNSTPVEDIYGSEVIRVPGSDKRHYAPRTSVSVMDEKAIELALSSLNGQSTYAILAFAKLTMFENHSRVRQFIYASSDAKTYARDLYDNLHRLDNCGADNIIIESVPSSLPWIAISDRLKRASAN